MKDCPVCSIPMDEVSKSGVQIDVCPRCKGVWLDRGELNRLLESAREYRKEDEDYYEKHSHYEDDDHKRHYDKDYYKHGGRKKKRGFLSMFEDIFD